MINVYSRSLKAPVITHEEMTQGSIRSATVSFVNAADKLGTTVSSVTWTAKDDSDLVAITSAALSSGVATATITADSDVTGCCIVQVKATMANGQTVTEHIQIEVSEVEC